VRASLLKHANRGIDVISVVDTESLQKCAASISASN